MYKGTHFKVVAGGCIFKCVGNNQMKMAVLMLFAHVIHNVSARRAIQ
jgi:hypothetical protein